MNVLGVVNGETTPVWKVLFDSTHPEALGTAAEGSGVVAALRNHVHEMPKLDDVAAPDDNTDRNATTSLHGLVPKAVDPASAVQRHVVCIDNGETAYKNADLFDDTHPEAIGTATEGTSLLAAHRDHVHAGLVDSMMVIGSKTGSLVINVPLSPYGIAIARSGATYGAITLVGALAICDTVGAGTNTIIIQADSDNTFGSPTTIFSLSLDTATLVSTTTFVNAWTSTDIYFRAYPSAVGGTAPQNTRVQLDFTRAVR
jgi:hypothetical protein